MSVVQLGTTNQRHVLLGEYGRHEPSVDRVEATNAKSWRHAPEDGRCYAFDEKDATRIVATDRSDSGVTANEFDDRSSGTRANGLVHPPNRSS